MDLEFLFYLVVGVIGILLSLRKNKKRQGEQSGNTEEFTKSHEDESMDDFFRRMSNYAQETGENRAETEMSQDEIGSGSNISRDAQPAAGQGTGNDEKPQKDKEIDTVKDSITQKKASVLDLRKAVIYRTILDRKYF